MILSIDVGGTKTLVATFSNDGELLESKKFPTPKEEKAFFTTLFETITTLEVQDLQAIGAAMPGLIDREKGIVRAFGNLDWRNVAVREKIQTTYPDTPVYIENDANLAGLAEAQEFDPEKYPLVVYVTVSTGIGSGAIYKHKIHPFLEDTEAGSMHLRHNGEIIKWEHLASGKAIKAKYDKLASEIDDPQVWDEIADNLALGFSNIVALLQPNAIVIGGGVGTHLEKFIEPLEEKMLKIAANSITLQTKKPPIIKAKHPEQAVVYGAYLLCKQKLGL